MDGPISGVGESDAEVDAAPAEPDTDSSADEPDALADVDRQDGDLDTVDVRDHVVDAPHIPDVEPDAVEECPIAMLRCRGPGQTDFDEDVCVNGPFSTIQCTLAGSVARVSTIVDRPVEFENRTSPHPDAGPVWLDDETIEFAANSILSVPHHTPIHLRASELPSKTEFVGVPRRRNPRSSRTGPGAGPFTR